MVGVRGGGAEAAESFWATLAGLCGRRLNALIELLDEKGLTGKEEILEGVKRLQAQTQLGKRPR
jgi:hypothetical protein